MKNARRVPAVTSLPQSAGDESDHRVRRYALTMSIRIACFGLMVLVQPYGWYTWVFAAAAAVLPYIAVVFANAGADGSDSAVESPVYEIEAPAAAVEAATTDDPSVIQVQEDRQDQS